MAGLRVDDLGDLASVLVGRRPAVPHRRLSSAESVETPMAVLLISPYPPQDLRRHHAEERLHGVGVLEAEAVRYHLDNGYCRTRAIGIDRSHRFTSAPCCTTTLAKDQLITPTS